MTRQRFGPSRTVIVERIDFYDFDSCTRLKHAIWSSRDPEWLRGAAVMLLADVANSRQNDEWSQTLLQSITTTDDSEWLRSTAESLLERNRELEAARRRSAAVPRGRVVLEREVIRDPVTGLIVKARDVKYE